VTLGPLADEVVEATHEAMALAPRIMARDHTVWGEDPTEIADRLGWLDAPARAEVIAPELQRLAAGVREDGITDVLLVGMGGSSLYPDVLARTFGSAAGYPRLRILDSTDPAAVLDAERSLPWGATLVIPASKSGTTIEMVCHLERFLARLHDAHGASAGHYVLPITDPGSELDARAADEGFRGVVHGQPDVGGRFSALTPFGLLPATLLGLDPREHVVAAGRQLAAAAATEAERNGPVALGAAMAAAARSGRDKLTLLLPESVASFGAWIEQLVAESLGKHGQGVVPVLGEDLESATFGDDRLVVAWGAQPSVPALVRQGVPVVALPWPDKSELSGEVLRLEIATAVAGALLGLNPFDQPDVAAAKAATDEALRTARALPPTQDPAGLLATIRPGDYVALLGFVTPGGQDHAALDEAAAQLRLRTGVPVTVGIGPRYLHSTGQLHKGGPDRGVFLVVVGDDPQDASIPGREFGFAALKRAQAVGDLTALAAAGRRVVRVELDDLRGR